LVTPARNPSVTYIIGPTVLPTYIVRPHPNRKVPVPATHV
jgi:hypothetical protein